MAATSRITGVALLPLTLPLRKPFVTAQGEKRVSRNLLVAVRLADGSTGYGEASASLAWPKETREAMTRALRPLIPRLIGSDIRSVRRLAARAWESAGRHPTAAAALECALFDAWARARGVSLWKWLGGKKRSVTTSLTLSAWKPEAAARAARRAAAMGFRRLKVKVTGRDADQDIRRVIAVHRAARKARLWVDANQGFDIRGAVRFAHDLRQRRLPVDLLEQPLRRENWKGLGEVEREGGIPVAADESARSVEEARRLIRGRVVSAINIKLAKSGLAGAQQIIRLARPAGVRLMIGCMAESALGLSHSVALACGSGAFTYVDLDSHLLVVSPRCQPGFSTRGPRLWACPSCPGSGADFPGPR